MTGFNARTGLEELEEYAVEHVAADIIVNANESNYNLPRPIEQAVAAKLAGFPFNRYPPMQAETLRGLIAEIWRWMQTISESATVPVNFCKWPVMLLAAMDVKSLFRIRPFLCMAFIPSWPTV